MRFNNISYTSSPNEDQKVSSASELEDDVEGGEADKDAQQVDSVPHVTLELV